MNYHLPEMTAQRPLDVICLGRAGVDLYSESPEQTFSEVQTFAKFVGGSPANIAAAVAKLGGKVGFIGGVSDDGLGHYVCDYLRGLGVDLAGMQIVYNGARTSLAITEMRPEQPEVVIYRNNAADLAIQPSDIDKNYIASARLLLVSGTALCASPSREATLLAMEYAQQSNTRVVLDMDYRAYSWENPEAPAIYYNQAARKSDIIIGNREEFDVLEYLDTEHQNEALEAVTAYRYLQALTQVVIVKDGANGSDTYTTQGEFHQGVFPAEVKKPFGAGDAFAGSLMFALLHDYSLQDAVAMGSAAAAINVSGTSCSEAMPMLDELLSFMATQGQKPKPQVQGGLTLC